MESTAGFWYARNTHTNTYDSTNNILDYNIILTRTLVLLIGLVSD